METLTKAETADIQQHAESLSKPASPESAFTSWAEGVVKAQKTEAKERPEPKDAKPVDLSKLTHEQLQHWNKTSEIPKSEKTESSEQRAKADEKASTANEGDFIDVRAEVEPTVRKLGERAWTEQLQGKDHDDWMAHVHKQAKSGVDFIAKHERSREIQSGLTNLLAGFPQAEAQARFEDCRQACTARAACCHPASFSLA